jgi:hypothetical protein
MLRTAIELVVASVLLLLLRPSAGAAASDRPPVTLH